MRELLTPSRIRSYRGCNQKHRWKYEEWLEPVRKDEAARFGSLMHSGLERWWTPGVTGSARLLAAKKGLADFAAAHPCQPFELAAAEVMLECYDARWRDEPIEPVLVEQEYRVRLINPETGRPSATFDRGGKIDVLAIDHRFEDHPLILVEHKNTNLDISPGSDYWKRLRLDAQVSEYMVGGSSLGHGGVRGCLYDVLARPMWKPRLATPEGKRTFTKGKPCKKHATQVLCANCDGSGWVEPPRLYKGQRDRDETMDEFRDRLFEAIARPAPTVTEDVEEEAEARGDGYAPKVWFVRDMVHRIGNEAEMANRDAWATSQQILLSKRLDSWPRNDQNCSAYNRTCEYFDLCCGLASPDDITKFTRRTSAHAELSNPSAAGDGHGSTERIADLEAGELAAEPVADLEAGDDAERIADDEAAAGVRGDEGEA